MNIQLMKTIKTFLAGLVALGSVTLLGFLVVMVRPVLYIFVVGVVVLMIWTVGNLVLDEG